ncbi:hypothetical protein Pfo_008181, partial [Paulownia fortunei]
ITVLRGYKSRTCQFPKQLKSLYKFSLLFSFSFLVIFKMGDIFLTLKKRFPFLPKNAILKIYKIRIERLRMLMHKGIPEDIRWIIEAKVRAGEFSHEFPDLLTRYMSG